MITLRKSPVVFYEDEHRYFLGDKELRGVTSTLIDRAFPDRYKGVDQETLDNAKAKGKALHAAIEYFDNFGGDPADASDDRIAAYARIKQENRLTTIANEYLISDEQHYASSIDIVMVNADSEICLVDTKTTYSLDPSSVALQLSVYRRFFESQNPGLKVAHIYVLWLPNRDHSIAQLNELSFVADEVIDSLIEADLEDKPFDIATAYGNLPARLAEVEGEIVRIETEMKVWKGRQEELKQGLYRLMEKHNVKSFTGSRIKLTRVLPTTAETIDTKRLKEEQPDIYEKYTKRSTRSGSLKITIQNKEKC